MLQKVYSSNFLPDVAGYQAVFKEIGDHSVSWQYMTHPSLLQFAAGGWF